MIMRAAPVKLSLLGAAVLTACASQKPLDTQALEQARTEVHTFSANPAASEIASHELAASRSSLSEAEEALRDRKQEDLDYYAYLAVRQAKTGEARIAEKQAKQRLAQVRGQREQVVLDARNAELEAQSKLAAQLTERGMVLTLSGVLFDTGKATLKPGAAPALNRVSTYMTQYPRTRLLVEGYTDNQGSRTANQQLSELRAQAVADALVMRGVPRNRIDTVGRGPSLPVANNDTPEGRDENRRVEMVFSDDLGRFAEAAVTGVNR